MSSNVEIRIRGTLPADAAERLGHDRQPRARGHRSYAARWPISPRCTGVLDRLRCNGIELIDVRRLPDRDERDR